MLQLSFEPLFYIKSSLVQIPDTHGIIVQDIDVEKQIDKPATICFFLQRQQKNRNNLSVIKFVKLVCLFSY